MKNKILKKMKVDQLDLEILTKQEKETCVLAINNQLDKYKDIVVHKLQNKVDTEFCLSRYDIDYNLIDAIRAYFQQIYDLEGLLLVIMLANQENMISKEMITYIENFLSSQYREDDTYGYNNPFISSSKTTSTYINYCSIFLNLIRQIIDDRKK